MTPLGAKLERRARRIRGLTAVRRWEYRQRDLAQGAWYRLRRLLTFAAEVWALEPAEADRLLAEGFVADPVGQAFEPPRVLLVIPRERLLRVAGKRPVVICLDCGLLAERWLALVPWSSVSPPKDAGRP
ncbi:MAG: hypothetical protein RBU45_10555 [Myxococcota bacterium]|jgi:hypothetical protein|nr:hypothetical protein [Myxococcota bacterium]